MGLALMLLTGQAKAYSYMHTDDGQRLHLTAQNPWEPGPYVPLVGNTRNASGITPEQLKHAVVRGLRMWQQASGHAFSFDYWQGTEPSTFEVGMKRDGLSTIFFASADPKKGGLTPYQSAYTRVYFDPDSGEIDEVDIVLNDIDMTFTADPAAANYLGGGTHGPTILLQDVIAHELGHVLGLGHSGVLDATMFAFGWPGQADLSCDDMRAVQSLYGTEQSRGTLSGRVLDPEGSPILGAHVVAIDVAGPSVAASAMTSNEGFYHIDDLPSADYVLMVEPFMAGPSALDDIYANANLSAGCPQGLFSRTFYGPLGKLSVVHLEGEATLRLEDVSVACDGVSPITSFDTYEQGTPELAFDARGFLAALLVGSPNVSSRIALETHGGPLDLAFMSYSLFSPAFVLPTLDTEGGPSLTSAGSAPTEDKRAGDAHLSVDYLPAGSHVLSFATQLATSNLYPMGSGSVDSQPFVLVVGRQQQAALPAACWGPEPSTDYTSPSGQPRRITVADDNGFAIHCGVIAPGRHASAPLWSLLSILGVVVACVLRVRRRAAACRAH